MVEKKRMTKKRYIVFPIFFVVLIFVFLFVGFRFFPNIRKLSSPEQKIKQAWQSVDYARGKMSFSLNIPRLRRESVLIESDDLLFYFRNHKKNHQFSMEGSLKMKDEKKEETNRVAVRLSGQEGCVSLNDMAWSSVHFSEDFYLNTFYSLSEYVETWKKESCKKKVNGCHAYCLKGVLKSSKNHGKLSETVNMFLESFVSDCLAWEDSDIGDLSVCWYFQKESDKLLAVSIADLNGKLRYQMDFDLINQDFNDDVFILYDNYVTDNHVYHSPFACLYSFFGMTDDFFVTGDWQFVCDIDDFIGDVMTVREGKKETYRVGFRGYRSLQSVKLEEDPVRLSVAGSDSSLYSYAYLADKVNLNLYDTVYTDHSAATDYYKNREKAGDIRGRKISRINSFVMDGHPVYTYSYEYTHTDADSRKEFCQSCYLYYVGLGNTYVVIAVESQTDAGTSAILNDSLADDVFHYYGFLPVQ